LEQLNHRPAVSLIIPVYNVESYLRKALDSAAAQTLQNIEVIMVNDGSTDNCPQIMREYAEKYPHFHFISQENGGLSAARNTALKQAQGEYIAFLDSDDFLAPTFLETLYHTALKTGAEIVCCNYYFYMDRSQRIYPMPIRARNQVRTKQKALNKLLRDVTLHHFAWNKLVHRSLFFEHGIEYPDMFFEDIATTPRLFYYANKVAILTDKLYYYTKRSSSILGSMNAQKINDYVRSVAVVRTFLEKNHDYSPYRFSFTLYCYRCAICNTYSVLRLHLLCRTTRGMGGNLRRAIMGPIRYRTKEFTPGEDFPTIPPCVETPQKKK
jgi:glycosyltransferase involved in cell wall biosynthesis